MAARNDETVGVAVDLLLCAHASLFAWSCAAISRMGLKKLVFFEAPQKFTNVTPHNVRTNAEFAANFPDDLGFRPTAFQHSKDLGSHDVEGEHLAMMDVEDDGAVALVGASNSFGNLQQGFPLPNRSIAVVNMAGECHENKLPATRVCVCSRIRSQKKELALNERVRSEWFEIDRTERVRNWALADGE